MDTEEHLKVLFEMNPDGTWIKNSDFYQELYERNGDTLWPTIPTLLGHPSHDVRCCGVILAGTRRPESVEAMRLIAPLMRDPHPLVRLTVFQQLQEFSWVDEVVEETVREIRLEEELARDKITHVLAIRLLLKADFAKYSEEMIPELELIWDLEFRDGLVRDFVRETLQEYGRW